MKEGLLLVVSSMPRLAIEQVAHTTHISHSLTGIGEIVLLPLDVLKIKRQTNPEAFRSRGFLRIVSDEGMGLYRGAGWTAARNAPGSFALFGGSALTKEYLFGLEDYASATWTQNFVASIGGAVASITVAAPLDVVKTRIQNANFESKTGGVTIIKDMIKHEGFGSFFKGLTPKVSSCTREEEAEEAACRSVSQTDTLAS